MLLGSEKVQPQSYKGCLVLRNPALDIQGPITTEPNEYRTKRFTRSGTIDKTSLLLFNSSLICLNLFRAHRSTPMAQSQLVRRVAEKLQANLIRLLLPRLRVHKHNQHARFQQKRPAKTNPTTDQPAHSRVLHWSLPNCLVQTTPQVLCRILSGQISIGPKSLLRNFNHQQPEVNNSSWKPIILLLLL